MSQRAQLVAFLGYCHGLWAAEKVQGDAGSCRVKVGGRRVPLLRDFAGRAGSPGLGARRRQVLAWVVMDTVTGGVGGGRRGRPDTPNRSRPPPIPRGGSPDAHRTPSPNTHTAPPVAPRPGVQPQLRGTPAARGSLRSPRACSPAHGSGVGAAKARLCGPGRRRRRGRGSLTR